MDTPQTFIVTRAKPSDSPDIAKFVESATRGRISVDSGAVVNRFAAKGLWLIRDAEEQIVGLAGWRVENLIARIDDFLIFPHNLYANAGRVLVEAIEAAAQELQCEVSMVFVPMRASPILIRFYQSCGYERADPEQLPRLWQETVEEATGRDRYIMLRQLREDLVLRPI